MRPQHPNQPSIPNSPWLDYEVADIMRCVQALWHNDEAAYALGWDGLARGTVGRVIGGLAHALGDTMAQISDAGALPQEGPAGVEWLQQVAQQLPPTIGLAPDELMTVLDWTAGADLESTWGEIVQDSPRALAMFLGALAAVIGWWAAASHDDPANRLHRYLAQAVAPDLKDAPWGGARRA